MINWIRNNALIISWLIALSALLTSLYFSEVLQWPVCQLCWYQRIFIYPQAILLGMAAMNDDYSMLKYALALSVVGLLFAGYQYLVQLFPLTFEGILHCSAGISCATKHINWFGFVTLPLISVATFTLLIITQAIGSSNGLHDTRG